MLLTNEKLLNLSKSTTIEDDIEIVENTFFLIWCYNEYRRNIFKTGFKQHYKNLLSESGFIHKTEGEIKKFTKKDSTELKKHHLLNTKAFFEQYLEFKYPEETEKILEQNKNSKEYKAFMSRKATEENMGYTALEDYINSQILKIKDFENRQTISNFPTRKECDEFEILMTDEYALKHYFDLLYLLKTEDYINDKLNQKRKESFNIITTFCIANKLKLIKMFETHYKIERFNFDFSNVKPEQEISQEFQTLYLSIFDTKKTSFKTVHELLLIYLNMIRNICGDIPVIHSKPKLITVEKKRKKIYEYNIDLDIIRVLLNIAKHNNPTLKHFNLQFVESLTGIKPDENNKKPYVDEDNLIDSYLFNKHNYKSKNVMSASPSNTILHLTIINAFINNFLNFIKFRLTTNIFRIWFSFIFL